MRSLLHAPRTRKRSIAAATLGALALIGSLLVVTPAQALNDTGTGGVFVPSTGRILDTAKGTGGFSTPMEAGKYRTIKVAGLAGLPDDGSVGAVSLNATVGASTGYGTLFGRPDADTGRATMMIYNGVSGEYTSNTATVAVGMDGTIQVMTETASRLILDVQGYYTANTDGTAAGGFVPVAKRIVDTRSGVGAAKAALAPGKSVDVQITGSNGIPAGASGVVVNLIAINGTEADGYLTPYATGGTKPANSLHYAPSESTSIQAQVPLSADGKITIANSSTTANLLVDLQGYFTAAGKGGAVFTPAYGRAYDSRATGNTALAENETRSIQIAGTAGVPVMGSGVTAVVLTLIVAHGGSNGYADAWADGTTKPNTSAINFTTNEIQTNTITVPLGANGKIALRNAAKATNYVVDVQGWYYNPQAPKVTCDAPAKPGAWVTASPEQSVKCSAIFPPAPATDVVGDIVIDGNNVDQFVGSTTGNSIRSFAFLATAGTHEVQASVTQPDGTFTSSTLSYAFWPTQPSRTVTALQQVAPELLNDLSSIEPTIGDAIALQGSQGTVIPSDPAQPILVGIDASEETAGGSIRLSVPAAGSAQRAASEGPGLVSFDQGAVTTVPAMKSDGSVQLAHVLWDQSAPERLSMPFEISQGLAASIVDGDDEAQGVIIRDAEDRFVAAIAAPWARDSLGRTVPTRFELADGTLTQVVDHASSQFSYPIVADPFLGRDVFKKTWWTGKKNTKTRIAHMTTSAQMAAAWITGNAYNAGWPEAKKKLGSELNQETYRQQYACHAAYAPAVWAGGYAGADRNWDLEYSRGTNKNYAAAWKHKCNW